MTEEYHIAWPLLAAVIEHYDALLLRRVRGLTALRPDAGAGGEQRHEGRGQGSPP
jgi:hypothetical protein